MTALETYEVSLPGEPPVGSVVLTPDGEAWLRRDHGWCRAAHKYEKEQIVSWAHLVVDHPSVVLLHLGGKR